MSDVRNTRNAAPWLWIQIEAMQLMRCSFVDQSDSYAFQLVYIALAELANIQSSRQLIVNQARISNMTGFSEEVVSDSIEWLEEVDLIVLHDQESGANPRYVLSMLVV